MTTIIHNNHGGGLQTPELIVVHSMGEYILDGGKPLHAVSFLEKYQLSAHVLVSPNGEDYILREDIEIAWHARGYNKNSLGIEFLVEGEHTYGSFVEAIKKEYVTEKQYYKGLSIIKRWLDKHHITKIKRHSDLSPGRKVDPGDGFPWSNLLHDIGL